MYNDKLTLILLKKFEYSNYFFKKTIAEDNFLRIGTPKKDFYEKMTNKKETLGILL